MPQCSNCGARNRLAARFCTRCGETIESDRDRALRAAMDAARSVDLYREDGTLDCEQLRVRRAALRGFLSYVHAIRDPAFEMPPALHGDGENCQSAQLREGGEEQDVARVPTGDWTTALLQFPKACLGLRENSPAKPLKGEEFLPPDLGGMARVQLAWAIFPANPRWIFRRGLRGKRAGWAGLARSMGADAASMFATRRKGWQVKGSKEGDYAATILHRATPHSSENGPTAGAAGAGVVRRGSIYAVVKLLLEFGAGVSGDVRQMREVALERIGLAASGCTSVNGARLRLESLTVKPETDRIIEEVLRGEGMQTLGRPQSEELEEEFESDRWWREAQEQVRLASEADDAQTRENLLQQADRFLANAHRGVAEQYRRMLSRAEAAQMFDKVTLLTIPLALSEEVNVLLQVTSGRITSLQAEQVLKRMESGSREIAREIGSFRDRLENAWFAGIRGPAKFSEMLGWNAGLAAHPSAERSA